MRIHGSRGQVLLDPEPPASPAPPVPVLVASLNSWTLDMARDKVDVTAFGDTNKQYVQGLPDVKGSIGGWYDNVNLTMFDVAAGDIPAYLNLVPDGNAPTYLWEGLAFLDASVNVSATGAVSVTSGFVGAGPWKRMPAPVAAREREPITLQ